MDAPREVREAPADARFGRYVAVSKLGAGGMGEVWRAWDTSLNRWVALKFLLGGEADDRDRFLREAQTAARLTHPNIAPVYEAGCERGRHFIAMHFVDGVTLRKLVKGDLRRAVGYVRDAARALDYAHGRGVIHRDVKPDNIMVERPGVDATSTPLGSTPAGGGMGRVYVMDFGLARSVKGDARMSASGILIGTPAYMPPEQARGERVDRRADIYALGATLYEVMAGAPPFEGASVVDMLMRVINDEPAELPGAIGAVVAKAMAKEPQHRYRTAAEFADDLDRWLAGEPVSARPPSTFQRLGRQLARRRGVLVTAAAGVIAVAIALAIVVPRWRAEARARAERERKLEASAKSRPHLDRARELRLQAERLLTQDKLQLGVIADLLERARAEARRAIEADATAEAWLELARAWALARRGRDALEALDRAVEADAAFDPARRERIVHLANDYMNLHDDPSSVKESAALWKRIEGDAAALGQSLPLVQAVRAFGLAQYAESAAGFERYVAESAGDAVALCLAGHAWMHAGRAAESAAVLERAVGLRRDMKAAWLYLAMARCDLKRWEDAIHACDNLLALDDRFARALGPRAEALKALGRVREAEEALSKAIGLEPSFATYYEKRALLRLEQKRFREAEADYQKMVDLAPTDARPYYDRGLARQEQGRLAEAEADYRRAIELDATYALPHVNLGSMKFEAGAHRDAVEHFTRAIELDPATWNQRVGRGYARAALGEWAGALEDFEEAVRINPALEKDLAKNIEEARKKSK